MVYYYGWDRLDARTHLRVGWIYFATAWASLAVISGILAFMLTSGRWPQTRSFADGFWNPTYLPMVALRTAAAVGLAGLYALFAASFLKDADLKARVARWSAARWIAPAAGLAASRLAVVPVGRGRRRRGGGRDAGSALGLAGRRPAPACSRPRPSGHPVVRAAARAGSWPRRCSSLPRSRSWRCGPDATAASRPGS